MALDKPTSRNIPEPIKREVRQRCGFGCVICGLPLYEYEHMAEWAIVQRHIADEITLLCDKHHREKTNGLLPKEKVLEANLNPYNIINKSSAPYFLHYSGDFAEIEIVGNIFSKEYHKDYGSTQYMRAIVIDGLPILGFAMNEQELLLKVVLFNKYNFPIFQIDENQILLKKGLWDINFVGTTLTLREKLNDIFLELKFIPPNKVLVVRGSILYNGVKLEIRKENLIISNQNIALSKNEVMNCEHGLTIGNGKQGALYFRDVNRY